MIANSYPVKIEPNGLTTYTGSDGNFLALLDSGSYTVRPDTFANFSPSPLSRPVSFTSQTGVSQGNNFALQPLDTSLRDLHLYVFEDYQSAPGFPHSTYIEYLNLGVQPLQPVLTFIKDPLLVYNTSSPLITSQNGDTLKWILPVLAPFQSDLIRLETTLSLSAQLGQGILNIAYIDPIAGDATPLDNMDSTGFIVMGSYDPNAKEVRPLSIRADQTQQQNVLDYTIHFQNTGTDSTHFIVVKDKLPVYLNPATLHVMASSHPCDYFIEEGNVLVFRFNDCKLPDSTTDAKNSQGFVSFTIAVKEMQLHTNAINNAADIYFDYNPAITTNTAETKVEGNSTSISKIYGDLKIVLYPNPSSGEVNIESEGLFHVELLNLWGVSLFNSESVISSLKFDVSNYPSGMYLMRVTKQGRSQGYLLSVVNH